MGSPDEWIRFSKYAAAHWPHVLLALSFVIIFLLIQDPDRGDRIRANILEPLFRLFKLFPRQFIAARIGSSATIFLKKYVAKYITTIDKVRIRVKWVRSAKDPVLKRDGTVLLHIPETNDQTLNVMRATDAALPSIVCRSIRKNLDSTYSRAIDLTILKSLAQSMGTYAYPIFQRHFLAPATAEDLELQELLVELVEIDNHGIFTTIFLNELESLGIELFNSANDSDVTSSVRGLLEFLLQFPRRKVGEEIRLTYNTPRFKVAVILVAKTFKAVTEGESPYVKRVQRNLSAGIDSIYLYAYEVGRRFFGRVCDALKEDERLWMENLQRVPVIDRESGRRQTASIVHLTRNPLFCDTGFQEKIDANGLAEGSLVRGRIVAVSQTSCLVETCGLVGSLPRNKCSWNSVQGCEELYSKGDIRDFVIHQINRNQGTLILSARLPDEDPWLSTEPPHTGDTADVTVDTLIGNNYVSHTADGIEITIPRHEVSWLPWECGPESVIGQPLACLIIEKDQVSHVLVGSHRQLQDDPWPDLQKSLVPGTKFVGTVENISDNSIQISTEDGLRGFILGTSLENAGYGFDDYRKTLVSGAKLDVVVEKVFRDRRKIRFTLRRSVHRDKN